MSKVLFLFADGSVFTKTRVDIDSLIVDRSADGRPFVSYLSDRMVKGVSPETLVDFMQAEADGKAAPFQQGIQKSPFAAGQIFNVDGTPNTVDSVACESFFIDAQVAGLAYIVVKDDVNSDSLYGGKGFLVLPVCQDLTLSSFPDMFKLANLLDEVAPRVDLLPPAVALP